MMAGAIMPSGFRPDDPEVQKDPYAFYPVLRAERPVLQSSFFGQPCWILSRRADIAKALMDPKTFSSRTTPIPILLFADPPEHERLRKMVAPKFTRVAIQPMAELIAAESEALLDDALAGGGCDIIEDFAAPLTVTMISRLLGISTEQVYRLRELSRLQASFVLAIRLGLEPPTDAREASATVSVFMGEIIDSGTYHADGVVALLSERLGDGELTRQECVDLIVLLFVAGRSTTTNAIGNAVYMLTQRSEYISRIATDEAFVGPFLEEVLRTRPSFHRIERVTTRAVEMDGVTIPAKALVLMLLGSANRDETVFNDPEAFVPDTERRAHITFGQGIHSCLGLWLARLEASTSLSSLARRVSSITLNSDNPPVPVVGGTFNEFGFDHLPVHLAAREPTGIVV